MNCLELDWIGHQMCIQRCKQNIMKKNKYATKNSQNLRLTAGYGKQCNRPAILLSPPNLIQILVGQKTTLKFLMGKWIQLFESHDRNIGDIPGSSFVPQVGGCRFQAEEGIDYSSTIVAFRQKDGEPTPP